MEEKMSIALRNHTHSNLVQKHCKETAHTLHAVGMPEILVERIKAHGIHWSSSCFSRSKGIQLSHC